MTRTIPRGYYIEIPKGVYSIESLYNLLGSDNQHWLFNLSQYLLHSDQIVQRDRDYEGAYTIVNNKPFGYKKYHFKNIGGL